MGHKPSHFAQLHAASAQFQTCGIYQRPGTSVEVANGFARDEKVVHIHGPAIGADIERIHF